MPICKETLQFFNLQFAEEESPLDNNGNLSNNDIVEQNESMGKCFLYSFRNMK